MAALDDKLYALQRQHSLVPSSRGQEYPLRIGQANNLVTMAAANGKLFCITKDNKRWSRDAAAVDIDWAQFSDVPIHLLWPI